MSELTKDERKFIDQQLTLHHEQEVYCVKALLYSQDKKKGVERIFVVGENRIYAIKVKGAKIEVWLESHLLDIVEVTSSSFDALIIKCKSASFSFEKLEEDICQDIIEVLYSLLKQSFPGKPENLLPKFTITPEDRFSTEWFEEEEGGPCGDFVKTYRCVSDYYGIAPREDLCYDFDIIYPLNSIEVIDFADMGLRKRGLSANDIKAITMSLSFNKHFTALEATDCKLGNEGIESIASMMKHNTTIKTLSLSYTGTTKESMVSLASSLQSNSNHSLTSIDISRNELEEKGMISFANAITSGFHNGLTTLKVGDTFCGKGVIALAKALELNLHVANSLLVIDLGGNKLDLEGSRAWGSVFLKTKNLRKLNLQRTSPVFGEIICDLMEELILLDLTGNKISMNNMPELTKCISFCPNLEQVYFANCQLTGECVQYLFGNKHLMTKMSHLDLSDNEFGDDGIIETTKTLLARKNLKNIRLNKVWSKKTKNRAAAINALTEFVGKEGPGVETLELAGNSKAPLKSDILPFVFSLMTNRTVRVLDISGHQAGNVLGVGLGKVLQTNYTLEWLCMDDNNINYDGYRCFKAGLDRNTVLRNMPFPAMDFMNVVQSKTHNPTLPKFDKLLIAIQTKIYSNALHLNTEHRRFKEQKVKEMEEAHLKYNVDMEKEEGEDRAPVEEQPPEEVPEAPLTPTSQRVPRQQQFMDTQAATPVKTLAAQIQRARGETLRKSLFGTQQEEPKPEPSKPVEMEHSQEEASLPPSKVEPEQPVSKKPEPVLVKGMSKEIPVRVKKTKEPSKLEEVVIPPVEEKPESDSEDESLRKIKSPYKEEEDEEIPSLPSVQKKDEANVKKEEQQGSWAQKKEVPKDNKEDSDEEIPSIKSVQAADIESKEESGGLWAQKKDPRKKEDSDEEIPSIQSVQMSEPVNKDTETGGSWAQKKDPPKNVDSEDEIPTIQSVQMADTAPSKDSEGGLWATRKQPPRKEEEEDDVPTLPSVQMPDAAPRKQSTGQWAQKTNIKEKLQEKEDELPTLPSRQMPDAPSKKTEQEKWAQKVDKPQEKTQPAKQQQQPVKEPEKAKEAPQKKKEEEEDDIVSKTKPKGNNVESIYTQQGPASAWDENGGGSNKNSLRSKRPTKKYLRVKPQGIDTMKANQLFGELENYLQDNVPGMNCVEGVVLKNAVYDADDIEKARQKRATLK